MCIWPGCREQIHLFLDCITENHLGENIPWEHVNTYRTERLMHVVGFWIPLRLVNYNYVPQVKIFIYMLFTHINFVLICP